jgi:hypothetical protein
MRLSSLSLSVSLFGLVFVSGCAGTRWSVVDSRPLVAVTVAPAEIHGPVDRVLVAQRRASMIGELKARGYQVLEDKTPGVPTLTMKVDGKLIDDSQMHAADDPNHGIYNTLRYQFVAYEVHLDLVDAGGHVVVCGSASSNQDPEGAVAELTANLVRDIPAAASSYAAR